MAAYASVNGPIPASSASPPSHRVFVAAGEGRCCESTASTLAHRSCWRSTRARTRAGALPPRTSASRPRRVALQHGSDEQLTYLSADPVGGDRAARRPGDHLVRDEHAPLSRADPTRHAAYIAAQRKLSNRRWERISSGRDELVRNALSHERPRAGGGDVARRVRGLRLRRLPRPRGRSRGALACRLDRAPGPGGRTGSVRELRIVGPDTDLRRTSRDAAWLAADGSYNMPDGEVFTSPVETGTEGEIRYTFPAVYHGREVEDIRLGSRAAASSRRRPPAATTTSSPCSTWTPAPACSASSPSA